MLQKPEINTIYVAKYVFFCFVVETVYIYIYVYTVVIRNTNIYVYTVVIRNTIG